MTRTVLTDKAVENAKAAPKGSRVNHWDAVVPSLALRVTDKGHRSWIVQRRVNGRMLRVTLGEYPVLGLFDARESARNTLDDLSRGRDPRQRARVSPTALRKDSFEGAAEIFIARQVEKDRRPRTAEEIVRSLRNEFVSRWGSQPLRGITKSDVQDALDEIVAAGKPIGANRSRSALSVFFDWAVERGMAETNLAAAVRKPSKETARARVLTDDELREIWIHAGSLGWPFNSFFRALTLCGQRRSEVAGMAWDEIDRKARTWTIPAARTKNGRAHLVHLTEPLEQILDDATRLDDDDELVDDDAIEPVFTSNGKTPVSGFSRAKSRLDALILDARKLAAERAGDDPKKVRPPAPWTLHDLRRTAATGMARLGVHPHVVEAALNHVSGFRAGVAGVYQRHDFLDERRRALDLWAQHVVALIEPQRKPSVVVKMRRRGS